MDRFEVMLEPARVFLNQLADLLPRLGLALVILIIGYFVARAVKFVVVKALRDWEKQTREAFVKAYADATAGSGLYESFDDVRGLLRLAEMEKVLYELRYEKSNRPNWLHIPLRGLTALLQGG